MLDEKLIVGIVTDLRTFPEMINTKALKLRDLRQKFLERELAIDFTKLELLNKIMDETNVDGKVKYSNETKRKIELENRLKVLPEYVALVEEVKKLKKEIDEEEIALSYIKDKLNAVVSMCLVLKQ
jgi:hypothetical protein